jgi:hypothetical protein
MQYINARKYIFILIVMVTLTSGISNRFCDGLQSGNYFAVFDDQFRGRYGRLELTIDHNKALLKAGYLTNIYRIEASSDCKVRFVAPPPDTSSLSPLLKQLATPGTPYYEINHLHKDTLRFSYRQNAHITIYSGKFIFIREKKHVTSF